MSAFRWAFIGAGTLAGQVAKEITASGRHEIVSVYTRRFEKCEAFAQPYHALAARSAKEAIEAPGVDGVYVVTPHNAHFEYTEQALLAGKPVLCEKPLTVSGAEARKLVALARERGVYLAEAMWTWFSPVANQVKTWLDAGEYGEIQKARMTYHLRSIGYAPRVADPNRAGGALLDITVYPITYLYRLFGQPVSIRCEGKLEGGIDTGEEIELVFANGVVGQVSASIVDLKGLERLTLIGSKASTRLMFYHYANKVKLKRVHGRSETFCGDGSMLNEFDRVAEEIRAGLTESRYVPHASTLAVMDIMDTCRRQMGLVYPFEQSDPAQGGQY